MVAEAQVVRERVLRDLATRRKKARQQVEKLNAGRERLLQAYDVVRRTADEATTELTVSLSDARVAADAAARRIDDEPEPSLEQLDEEVRDAGLVELPIAEVEVHAEDVDVEEDTNDPGPFSGEVPVVVVTPEAAPPAEHDERRGRKGRRRKGGSFEGLPAGELTRVELPAEGEGIRILDEADETAAGEPESTEESPAESSPDVADAVADAAPGGGDEPVPNLPAANDVFARLRAEHEAGPEVEVAEVEVAEVAEVEVDAAPEPPDDPRGAPFRARDEALHAMDKELSRRLKRSLADEQNEVLDLLRRTKPKGVDDLLPSADDHAARWADTAAPGLAEAAEAGAGGDTPTSVTDLADELARHLTAPLRDRIDRSFAASDGNLDDVADRVRALYREWKGQRLSETSRHFLAAAFARGLFDGVAPGGRVQWVLDPAAPPCPDCDDNVLAGAIAKGEEFPTGHVCSPAHPGCRCLVRATGD